jgi:hypothetical protein
MIANHFHHVDTSRGSRFSHDDLDGQESQWTTIADENHDAEPIDIGAHTPSDPPAVPGRVVAR